MARRAGWVWRLGLGTCCATGGAVAAWWLAGQDVAWLGGAVGAVSGAFAPSLTDWARERTAARDALSLAGELAGHGPAGLLDPRRGLVRFVGREQELAALLAWCGDSRAHAVRLVTGPGGVGKTRLAVELCSRLEQRRWRCVRAGDLELGPVLDTVRRGWAGRVLLVVDYAETRIGLAGLLLAAAGTGEVLPVAVLPRQSSTDLVRAAVPVFAAALGAEAPSRVVVDAGAGPVRMLDLHAAALVAVLRPVSAAVPVRVSVADVLDELLGHEERFWLGAAEQQGLLAGTTGMTVAVLRDIVAAAALLGAQSQDQALDLLGRVPGAAASVKVASWLRGLYPPDPPPLGSGTGEWLGSLRPDRLAEYLVTRQFGASWELAGRLLDGLDERQALRALTLLGRAAADQQEAAYGLLERLLPLVEQVVAGLPQRSGC